jgi:hypothetical protein
MLRVDADIFKATACHTSGGLHMMCDTMLPLLLAEVN